MASTIKTQYGTAAQAITITLGDNSNGLANNAARESNVVDNSSNLFLDALVMLKTKTGASGVNAAGTILVYAWGTVDPATPLYPDTVTGSDAAITLTSPPNVRLIGVVNAVANATVYKGGPFSVAQAFGGNLPTKWGIIIVNNTGAALDINAASHLMEYQGILAQNV